MGKLMFYDLIKRLLTEHPEAQDDDVKLYAWVVKYQYERSYGNVLEHWTAKELLIRMMDGVIPSFITIWRMRQKVQQHCREKGHPHPCLCGRNWKQRLKREKSYRREIVDAKT